jgi:Flp pilus assembly CpaF family ATPase
LSKSVPIESVTPVPSSGLRVEADSLCTASPAQLTRLNSETTVSPEMISDAIDYVVLMKRRPNGPRYVADIQRVLGWRDNRYHLEPISDEHLEGNSASEF